MHSTYFDEMNVTLASPEWTRFITNLVSGSDELNRKRHEIDLVATTLASLASEEEVDPPSYNTGRDYRFKPPGSEVEYGWGVNLKTPTQGVVVRFVKWSTDNKIGTILYTTDKKDSAKYKRRLPLEEVALAHQSLSILAKEISREFLGLRTELILREAKQEST